MNIYCKQKYNTTMITKAKHSAQTKCSMFREISPWKHKFIAYWAEKEVNPCKGGKRKKYTHTRQ